MRHMLIIIAVTLMLSGCYSHSYHRDAGADADHQWDRTESHSSGVGVVLAPEIYIGNPYYAPHVPYGYADPYRYMRPYHHY